MTIAYIISAYKLPAMLVRLVRRLEAPGTTFLIHVDAKTTESTYRAMADPLADMPNVDFLPRHVCHWGDFGHVRATLEGLRALIDSDRPFDYVVLLTGQDYPIKSNAHIATTLTGADGRVFMHCFPLPSQHWTDGGMDRIEHWHVRAGDRLWSLPGSPFRNRIAAGAWARLTHGFRRRLPGGVRPFGGSSYWCIPADCARYVESFSRANEQFVKFFEHVHVPDEIFFNTIVMNSSFRDRVTGDDLHYYNWDAGGDNPAILTIHDLETVLQSDSLFARKFDPQVDDVVLDRLDAVLAGRGSRR